MSTLLRRRSWGFVQGTDWDRTMLPSSRQTRFSQVPAMYHQFFHTRYDYDLYTVPQSNAAKKQKYWPRGALPCVPLKIETRWFRADVLLMDNGRESTGRM